MDKIKKIIKPHTSSDGMEVDSSEGTTVGIDSLINDCKFNMKLQMADSAWKQVKELDCRFLFLFHGKLTLQCECCFQNNFAVATKILKELHKEAKTDRAWLLQWVHSFSRYNHKRSQTQGPVEQISAMLKIIPLLGN